MVASSKSKGGMISGSDGNNDDGSSKGDINDDVDSAARAPRATTIMMTATRVKLMTMTIAWQALTRSAI